MAGNAKHKVVAAEFIGAARVVVVLGLAEDAGHN